MGVVEVGIVLDSIIDDFNKAGPNWNVELRSVVVSTELNGTWLAVVVPHFLFRIDHDDVALIKHLLNVSWEFTTHVINVGGLGGNRQDVVIPEEELERFAGQEVGFLADDVKGLTSSFIDGLANSRVFQRAEVVAS